MPFLYNTVAGRVTTSDATTLPAFSIAIPMDSIVQIHITCIGTNFVGDSVTWDMDWSFQRVGAATATFIGSKDQIRKFNTEIAGRWNLDFIVNAGDVQFQITGDVGQTVTWGWDGRFTQMTL